MVLKVVSFFNRINRLFVASLGLKWVINGQGARHKEVNEQAYCRISNTDIGGLRH